jgi:hypothetical protein
MSGEAKALASRAKMRNDTKKLDSIPREADEHVLGADGCSK